MTITDTGKPLQQTKEIIGRSAFLAVPFDWSAYRYQPRTLGLPSVDSTRPDYEWWDKFRRGKQSGYELAALFCKPIEDNLTNWIFGSGVTFQLATGETNDRVEYTNDLLKRFSRQVRSTLMQINKDRIGLGDQFVVVNPDGSLSVPSPDTVIPEFDALDYRRMVKVTIKSTLPQAMVEDIWMADKRVITIKNTTSKAIDTRYGVIDPSKTLVAEFENLLGIIPIVHFPRGRSANEQFGHTIWELLRVLFDRYNNLAVKGLDGAEIMGNPILTFENIEDYENFRSANSTDRDDQVDTYGGDITRDTIHVDPSTGLVSPGNVKFLAPGIGFTKDIRDMLKLLFLLILEHIQIPETVWGGEMGQSRATSQEQMKTFEQMIEGNRLELEGEPEDPVLGTAAQGGLLALVSIWLRTKALTDPKIVVDSVSAQWAELSQTDEKLKFEKVQYAHTSHALTDARMLELLDIVENPDADVEAAREEADEQQDPFEAAISAALNAPPPDTGSDPSLEEEPEPDEAVA